MKKLLLPIFTLAIVVSIGVSVHAQRGGSAVTPDSPAPVTTPDSPAPNCPDANNTACISKSSPSTDINIQVRLKNPLKVNDIKEAIRFFVNALLKLAIPFIVVFFIWSGFRFILARGNPTEITKAKDMFLWTVIGTLLILGAWTITNAIIGTVNSISG